jgi:predicted Zn finger-like uncharacterized protein
LDFDDRDIDGRSNSRRAFHNARCDLIIGLPFAVGHCAMSWFTRCPACGVTYQVVPDQLKVAQAWLRCGQCQQAFDSTGLVLKWSLETETSGPGVQSEPETGDGLVPRLGPQDGRGFIEAALTSQSASERLVLDDFLKQEDRSEAHSPVTAVVAFEQALSTFTPQTTHPQAPYLQELNQQEINPQAQKPSRSWWPVALVVGLFFALALQWVWVGRHLLMAAEPAWVQPWQTVCRHLGCKLAPPPLRDGVVIDNSSLTPQDGGFELRWTVRNVTTQALEMPALELTWLDAQDKALVRRVFTLAEQGAPQALTAGQVWHGQLLLWSADGLQPLGYRLVNFYP